MTKTADVFPGDIFLGNAITYQNLGMVPLRPGDAFWAVPRVFLLEEALARGLIRITETDESGRVPFLRVTNRGAIPVLILDGEELVGGKQNRIVNTTILVPGETELVIPVSCIEARRWRADRSDFSAGEALFRAKSRMRQKADVFACLYECGAFYSDQHAVWQEVDETLLDFGAVSRTLDFRAARERARRRMADYEAHFSPENTQMGALFFASSGVLGCEVLGSCELFAKAFPKILRSFAFEVILSDQKAPERWNGVEGWWEQMLGCPVEIFPSPGAGQDVRMENDNVVGSALVWEQHLMHLSCFPKSFSDGKDTQATRTGRVSAGGRRRAMFRRSEER